MLPHKYGVDRREKFKTENQNKEKKTCKIKIKKYK